MPKTHPLARSFMGLLKPDQVLVLPHQLATYAYDASNLRGRPGLVLLPDSAEQAAACCRTLLARGAPFVPRGAGTNLAGATVAPQGEVVLSLARLTRVLQMDAEGGRALVECGVVNQDLQLAAAAHALHYAPDPASMKASTLGGNLGMNSGGPHCLKYGITGHHVLAVEMLDGRGRLSWLGDPLGRERRGPDLRGLAVGSEGCLGLFTRAWLRLLPKPKACLTALLSFPDIQSAVRAVSAIIGAGILPATLELMDPFILEAVERFKPCGYPRGAGAVLLAEVDGEPGGLEAEMRALMALARAEGCQELRLAQDEGERGRLWEGRRGAHAAVAMLRPSVWVEDGTVPRTRLAEAMERLRAIGAEEGLQVGYVFHAGDGNFHPLMLFDDRDPKEMARVRRAGGAMLRACVDLGGTITGEHGVGLDKREHMEYLHGPVPLQVMAEIKQLFDPLGLLNPGKLIPPEYLAKARPPAQAPLAQGAGLIELEPRSEAEAEQAARDCLGKGLRLWPSGAGLHRAAPKGFAGTRLSTRRLCEVFDYDPRNMTLEAGAGLTLGSARSLAAADGLALGFGEGQPGAATLGGLLSAAGGAPLGCRRAVKDWLLGVTAILPDGRRLVIGRKVVKNVAGFDLAKLFAGSGGAYGLVLRLILQLAPASTLPPRGAILPSQPAALEEAGLAALLKAHFDPSGLLPPLPS
jgi:D-lactate dehydrogenase (cytochrome)